MNIDYLKDVVLPQRAKEIKKGKNLGTRQPIYVVLDLDEQYISGHNEYSLISNNKGIHQEFGFIDLDLDCEERVFKKSNYKMKKPDEVTRVFVDRFVAFFLTSEAAHSYLKYQSHNLKNAYVYVFYSGYGNQQMDLLLNNQ